MPTLGAYATTDYYPHNHPVSLSFGKLSTCLTSDQTPDALRISRYASPTLAAQDLGTYRDNGQWLAGWQGGSVIVLVSQSTPLPIVQQEARVLDHLPGMARVFGAAA